VISITTSGDFKNTDRFLKRASNLDVITQLRRFGHQGVVALENATPVDSGLTAKSWDYKITAKGGKYTIIWVNNHVEDGVPIAIILQYGHGTRNGGYVQGRNYINPAIQPIFAKIAEDVWKVVTNA
jgi:hypothetical protein